MATTSIHLIMWSQMIETELFHFTKKKYDILLLFFVYVYSVFVYSIVRWMVNSV